MKEHFICYWSGSSNCKLKKETPTASRNVRENYEYVDMRETLTIIVFSPILMFNRIATQTTQESFRAIGQFFDVYIIQNGHIRNMEKLCERNKSLVGWYGRREKNVRVS